MTDFETNPVGTLAELAKLREERDARAAHVAQIPMGAIMNGQELLRRLADYYGFECEGGPIGNCVEFQELERCFAALLEYTQMTQETSLARLKAQWQEIPADACPVCHGSGTDQIKRRKDRPCGGCYGLGRVKEDGETPAEMWELAEVAGRVIGELRQQVARLEGRLALPGVAEAIAAEMARRQQAATDAQAEQERKWREGRGHGPGGARMTGD